MGKGRLAAAGHVAGMWIPALFLAFVFGMQGWSKFDDSGGWAVAFRHWGYPGWFRLTIGATEVLAAALLLWGRTAVYGAVLIVGVMAGGMATHVLQDGGRHIESEAVPLVLASIVLALRREQVMRLLRRTAAAALILVMALPATGAQGASDTTSPLSLLGRYVSVSRRAVRIRPVRNVRFLRRILPAFSCRGAIS
jgi:putative oxidoreductase